MNKISCLTIIFVSLLLFCAETKAQEISLSGIPEYASVSALVVDLETGEQLYGCDADRLLVPASLMKLVSTAMALEELGPEYKFSTRIWCQGSVENGLLRGNLIIEGGGDPTLGSRYFSQSSPARIWMKIRQFLRDAGIDRVEGKIIIDEHLFVAPRFPSPRLWEDMGNYYGAPPAALSYRDNTFELTLASPPAINGLCRVVSVKPDLDSLKFRCRVLSGEVPKDSAYIYGVPGMTQWEIRGSIPAGRDSFLIKGALPFPWLVFGRELAREVFGSSQIEVIQSTGLDWKHQSKQIGQIFSPPLSEIIRITNRKSINLMADHLLPVLVTKSGKKGSFWDAGPLLLKEFWKEHGNGSYVDIFDASGLSPSNAISARFLISVLENMYHSNYASVYLNSLAVSGSSGTLLNMWKKGPLKGKVFAKSGSMYNVLGYAGYVFPEDKHPYAFAFLVNHHGVSNGKLKRIIENNVEAIFR